MVILTQACLKCILTALIHIPGLLQIQEFAIQAAAIPGQFLMRALFHYSSFFYHYYFIRLLDSTQAMGDNDHGSVLAYLLHRALDQFFTITIQITGGFVKYQNRGIG